MSWSGIKSGCAWALIGIFSLVASAQPFAIDWSTIDGGGGTVSGGTFVVSATIGQPDAGATLTGGTFALTGGFWAGAGSGPPACVPDFDGDGFVDFFDFDLFVVCFEGGGCPPGRTPDIDGDGFVDFFDYDQFVIAFEAGC